MQEITNYSLCTGCHACYAICPVDAISMVPNIEGFLYPYINNDLCIDCGKCVLVCPINRISIKYGEINKKTSAYACINKDNQIRLESSSGGMFTLFSQEIIKRKGIVFGARFDTEFSVVHDYTNRIDDLGEFRGSKYVQSKIGQTFKEAKELLDQGKNVLFSGTPCQIAGLLSFLPKEYENLLCIDLICHGVPSPFLWNEYIKYRKQEAQSNIKNVSFRKKNKGWKKYSLSIDFENGKEYIENVYNDKYMNLFLSDVCLRESCYNCKFKTINRDADITLADFWAVDKIYPDMFDDKGISLVLVHSEKGQQIFNLLKKYFNYRIVSIDQAIYSNRSMVSSAMRPEGRSSFYHDLQNYDIRKIFRKYTYSSFSKICKKIRNKITKYLNILP